MVRPWRLLLLLSALPALAQDGTRVDLGAHKLNIVCSGAPDAHPVVILEAGGGGTSASWSGVQAALPATIRACAYDRAGSGKSDPGPRPRTMDAEVADLHALLEKSGVTQPIVFVGQSIGGILARLYFQKYPDSPLAEGPDNSPVVRLRFAINSAHCSKFHSPLPRSIRISPAPGPEPADDAGALRTRRAPRGR